MKNNYKNHPLIGKWHSNDADYDNVVYQIIGNESGLIVKGVDESDGEEFEITDLKYDESTLSFTSVMLSTNWKLKHKMYLDDEDSIVHEFIKTEIWKRIKELTIQPLKESQ